MMERNSFGLYLYQKERKDMPVLKDLLQLLKTHTNGRVSAFAYVEAETSLLPHLSLWENLQMVVGQSTWKEYTETIRPEINPLVRPILNPDLMASKAQNWEKFTIGLLKGMVGTGHLLIDMNEDLFSPLIIQNFKRTILSACEGRSVYLASATSGLWLDCAHTIVSRKEYEFVTQKLDQDLVKSHWAA